MNLDDVRDQLKDSLKITFDKIQESTLFIQLKEKFENLNPNMQTLVIVGTIVVVLGGFLMLPMDTISSSNQYLEEFDSKREITRELMRATRDAQQIPKIPIAPSSDSIVDQINNEAKRAQLLPEQILSVSPTTADSKLIPNNLTSGAVTARFAKLNLRQVLDMSHRMTQFGMSVKMTSLSINANSELPGYFDITAKVIALKVPQMDMSAFEDTADDKKGTKKKPTTKSDESGDSEE